LRAAGQNSDPNMNLQGTSSKIYFLISSLVYFSMIEAAQRSVSVDLLQLSTGQTSPRRPLTPNLSVDVPNVPQTSPPPPTTTAAKAAPPPPPPASSAPRPPAASGDRSQLLDSISDFSHAKLKKAKTNDRSGPKLK
jgi:hypothetical protein